MRPIINNPKAAYIRLQLDGFVLRDRANHAHQVDEHRQTVVDDVTADLKVKHSP